MFLGIYIVLEFFTLTTIALSASINQTNNPINTNFTRLPSILAKTLKLEKPHTSPKWRTPSIKPQNPPTPSKMICQKPRLKTYLRILRGTEVRRNDDFIPWRVRIGTNPEGRESRDHCGGTIISPRLVLTAAHCIQPFSNFPFFIYYDTVNPNDRINTKFAQADAVAWHDDYVGMTTSGDRRGIQFEHDIALLRFQHPLNFTGHAKPACLPWSNEDFLSIEPSDRRHGIVSGWGASQVDNPSRTPHQSCDLLKVMLSAMTTKECNDWYQDLYRHQPYSHPIRSKGRYPPMELTEDMFCARGLEQDADPEFGIGGFCYGDSGGGFDYQVNGKVYTVGIISTLYLGICGHSFPNKLIKTSSYLPWIDAYARHEGRNLGPFC